MPHFEKHIWAQFRDQIAQNELQALGPSGVDWKARTEETLELLLPRLADVATAIWEQIPRRLNAGVSLIEHVQMGLPLFTAETPPELAAWHRELRDHAAQATPLVEQMESQQVSAEIQRLLTSEEVLGKIMGPNGGSIYPDLLIRNRDYSMLPPQSKGSPVDGPCLRHGKPSNVPDGCEIKTNRGTRVKVDAHGAHAGLHVGITWVLRESKIAITGVWGGYIRIADHRESGRNVLVTTVKYSFGHDRFFSLLP